MEEIQNTETTSQLETPSSAGEKQIIDLNTNLTRDQALQVLIRAVQVAQAKGAFTLEDAELVSKAVRVFMPKPEN